MGRRRFERNLTVLERRSNRIMRQLKQDAALLRIELTRLGTGKARLGGTGRRVFKWQRHRAFSGGSRRRRGGGFAPHCDRFWTRKRRSNRPRRPGRGAP